MPSTIGHLLAGATVAWASDAIGGSGPHQSFTLDRRSAFGGLTIACAAVAAAPDLDLVLRTHRTYTHSIGATLVVALFAAAVAAGAKLPLARIVLACAAAHASHIFLDWLAVDRSPPYGIQAFWPFSDRFYISGVDLFRQTVRRRFFSEPAIRANALAVAQELVILGPVALAVWLVRVKTLAGFSTQMPRSHHAAE